MAAHDPEDYTELKAAAEEARVLLVPLSAQLNQLKELLKTEPTPALWCMAKAVHALFFLLRLEGTIISWDLASLAQYHQSNLDHIQTQMAIGALLNSYGVKKPMHFRIGAMTEKLTEAIPFYAKASDYPEMVRLIQEIKSQNLARQNEYYLLLEAVKKPFDEQHIKEFEAVRTYRLPVNIDFAALRKTVTDIVDLLEPIRQLARLMLPINARLLTQLVTETPPGS
jgi:hypothetical protein